MVFLLVLCLAPIFNISSPVQYTENGITDEEGIGKAIPQSKELTTPDKNDDTIELNSFSYSANAFATRWNDPGPVSDAITKAAVLTADVLTAASQIAAAPDKPENTMQKNVLYTNIGISIANSFVNIRKEPSAESEALGKLYKDSAAEILQHCGDWYYVESGSVKGYVKAEYIQTGIPGDELAKKYGQPSILVTVDGLNVRERADTTAERLSVIYKNEIYPIVALEGSWVKIRIPEDQVVGYIKREYADEIIDFKDAISKEEEEGLLALESEEWAETATQIKHRRETSYSKEELKLLACLVHSEAGSQSYEGKLAVANIVLNRVNSSSYPDSIKAVIYQSGQFSVADSGSLEKQLVNYGNYSSTSQQLSIKAAKAALEGDNNIGSRMYFHSYKAALKKGYDKKPGSVKLGDHLFW